MQIDIPELSVVTLIGASGSIKDVFAKKYFESSEVLPFEALDDRVDKRLRDGQLTVIDVEKVQEKTWKDIVKLAKRYHCLPVAIIFYTPDLLYEEGNKDNLDAQVEQPILEDQEVTLQNLVQGLEKKGFKYIYVVNNPKDMESVKVERTKLTNNKKESHGPFDVIGDIHGCYDELCELLEKLGYKVDRDKARACPPEGRKTVFLGDLVDRGPKIPKVLMLVMSMVKADTAYCVLGNHDGKLQRKLKGSNVKIAHGLEETLEQMAQETEQFAEEVKQFLDTLVSHYVFDGGKLVVVHAGLKEKLHGRESARLRDLAMFGETTGETDEFGLPVRLNWANEYSGKAFVIYGHTPQVKAKVINNTLNIDTGCVFGGKLTAFRYPEKEIVDVEAKSVYYEPARPLL